jgi:hypothetical protein
MISVLIPVEGDEPALIDTLAALVPAAADGLVRDLVLAARQDARFLHEVADAAGCGVAVRPGETKLVARVAASLKGPWVLVLVPGFVPGGDWMAEASDFLENADPARREAAVFSLSSRGGAATRLRSAAMNLRASLLGVAHPHLGLLATRDALAAEAGRLAITRLSSPIHDRRGRPRLR